jgi:hypothetical protein
LIIAKANLTLSETTETMRVTSFPAFSHNCQLPCIYSLPPHPPASFTSFPVLPSTMPAVDATPLLPGGPYISSPAKRNKILTSILIPLLLIGAVIFVSIRGDGVPKDPLERAKHWMNTSVKPYLGRTRLTSRARVIDGHVDLPIFVREAYANDVNKINLEKQVCLHQDHTLIDEVANLIERSFRLEAS